MLVYCFNPTTKVYTGSTWADESPLEPGVFLIPAHSTATPPPAAPQGLQAVWDGDSWELEAAPAPPPEPEPVFPARYISDRQFYQQLAVAEIITQNEALAAVKVGEIPTALSTFLDALSPGDRFAAEMLLSGATVFDRYHPLTIAVGSAQGMSSEQIDQFFIAAAGL